MPRFGNYLQIADPVATDHPRSREITESRACGCATERTRASLRSAWPTRASLLDGREVVVPCRPHRGAADTNAPFRIEVEGRMPTTRVAMPVGGTGQPVGDVPAAPGFPHAVLTLGPIREVS